jgi:cell division septum initiation protein DivIVA
MEECKLQNPHLNERRVAINDQIGNIQSRADAVVQMGQQITTKIDEICAAAKKECNDIILKKVNFILAHEN